MAAEKSINVLSLGKNPVQTVLLLSWPAIIEQIMLTMVNYVDTAMVGSLGAHATAAVGITASCLNLLNGLFAAFGVGFSIQVAQNIGAGDYEECRLAIRQAVLSVFSFGILVTLLCQAVASPLPVWLGADPGIVEDAGAYFRIISSIMVLHMGSAVYSAILRCSGDTKTPMLLNVLTNVLNVILNTLFIFPTKTYQSFLGPITLPGLGWGVRGAATASAISMGTIGLLLLITTFRRKGEAHISLRQDWRFSPHIWRTAAYFGLPVAFERFTISFGAIIYTTMVSRLGTVALAAHTIANTAEGISYLPANGIQFAATTLVGQAKGAEDREMAFRFGRIVTRMGLILGAVMLVVLFIFAEPLVSIFTSDPQVIHFASGVLRIEALIQPLLNASIVLVGVMRGGGDVRYQFFVSLFCMWGIRLVSAYVLAFPCGLGIYGIWCGMATDLGMRGVLNLLRFRTGKWYRDVG